MSPRLARRTGGLAELGADEVLSELEPEGSMYEVIVDGVGGPMLGAAMRAGRAGRHDRQLRGSTIPEPVSYPTRELFARAPGAKLYGLYVFSRARPAPAAAVLICGGWPIWLRPASSTRRSTWSTPGPRPAARSGRCSTAA